MRFLFALIYFPLLVISCSKDIRSTNRVNGSWKIEEISGTHHTSDIDGTIYFNNCDILDNDFRMMREDYSFAFADSTITVKNSGGYKFINDGKTLVLRRSPSEGTFETEYKVDLHTKDKLVFSGTEKGIFHTYSLRKEK